MTTILEVMQHAYREQLRADGIPLEPAQRTTDQAQTASLIYWAVMVDVTASSTITQAALEK